MAIDTATGKEAPAEISSERVKDIFSHHREEVRAVQRRLQLRRL